MSNIHTLPHRESTTAAIKRVRGLLELAYLKALLIRSTSECTLDFSVGVSHGLTELIEGDIDILLGELAPYNLLTGYSKYGLLRYLRSMKFGQNLLPINKLSLYKLSDGTHMLSIGVNTLRDEYRAGRLTSDLILAVCCRPYDGDVYEHSLSLCDDGSDIVPTVGFVDGVTLSKPGRVHPALINKSLELFTHNAIACNGGVKTFTNEESICFTYNELVTDSKRLTWVLSIDKALYKLL